MGDSWSYSVPQRVGHLQPLNVENKLFSMGHIVFNKSIYGGANSLTLATGETLVDSTKKMFQIDLVIWFHTELLRDRFDIVTPTYDYNEYLEAIHKDTIKKVMRLRTKTSNAKWAIIGGHAPLYNPKDYDWAEFKIDDWRAELLGVPLPPCQSLGYQLWLNDHRDVFGYDVVYEEQHKYNMISSLCESNKDKFYDGIHPSFTHCSDLATKIINNLF